MENKYQSATQIIKNNDINVKNNVTNHPIQLHQLGFESHEENNEIVFSKKKSISNQLLKHLDLRSTNNQKPKKRLYKRKGHWNLQQNAQYYLFLKCYLDQFVRTKERRLQKIFKQMSKFILTRSPNQCRSHHQKQQKKYIQLDILMSNLYELTKTHSLLQNQPQFSRDDEIYSGIFESMNKKQDENNQQNIIQQRGQLIIYEMPQTLKAISENKYCELFGEIKLNFY